MRGSTIATRHLAQPTCHVTNVITVLLLLRPRPLLGRPGPPLAQAMSSPRSAALVERALVEAGGVRTGGPPKADPLTGAKLSDGMRAGRLSCLRQGRPTQAFAAGSMGRTQVVTTLHALQRRQLVCTYVHTSCVLKPAGVYGYMHMDAWDLLYSVTAKAALAADVLRPGQMLAIIPGLLAVSRKTTLARSLRDMFGEAAWGIVPRSFKLPDELDEWGQWLAANPGYDTGYWMLKNNKQVCVCGGGGLRRLSSVPAGVCGAYSTASEHAAARHALATRVGHVTCILPNSQHVLSLRLACHAAGYRTAPRAHRRSLHLVL